MHILYVDESGTANEPRQSHFVLAGICLHESQTQEISGALDKIAARFNPSYPGVVELHGNHMYSGKGSWRRIAKEERIDALKECLRVLAESHPSNVVFVCILKKPLAPGFNPVELAFEQLSSRFDQYLMRIRESNNEQHGLVVFDKSTYETMIQKLAIDYQTSGHTWGVLKYLAEVPLFLDSRASRQIQLADLVAYAVFRCYESDDDQFFSIIKDRLDCEVGLSMIYAN